MASKARWAVASIPRDSIDPQTGNFLVADEYGPSLYSFDRKGRLAKEFETPGNLVPRVGGNENYVALRDACGGSVPVLLCGATEGRQDNRGYEGLAVSPRFAALCRAPGSADQRTWAQQRSYRPQRAHHRL
jgi:hypothetical protein